MNVHLRQCREFLAAVWNATDSGHSLQLNHYQLDMRFVTRTKDQHEINVAVSRVLYFIDQELSDTVFVHDELMDVAGMLHVMGINVTTVPHEPVDQIIGMMLFAKFQAMMEGRVDMVSLEISSDRGQGVGYLHHHDEELGPIAASGWWNQADTGHRLIDDFNDHQLPPLDIQPDCWRDLDLQWPVTPDQSKIVFANFRKNDDQ